MVYYGAWQQLDNFETRGWRINYDGTAQGAIVDIPAHDLGTGDALVAMTELLTEIAGSSYAPTTTTFGSAIAGATLLPQQTPLYGRAQKTLGTWRVGPVTLVPPKSIIPPTPEGAIDYEFQSPNGTVVGGRAALHNLSATGDADDPANGREGDWGISLGIASDSGTVPLTYSGATTIATWTQDSPMPRYDTVDIGSYLSEQGHFQFLGGNETLSVTAFRADPIVDVGWATRLALAIRTDDRDLPNAIRVYYDVRPPLFRWIYDRPQLTRAAPLRVLQRGSDGLGITGGRRAFGKRTIQSSNRAFGIR